MIKTHSDILKLFPSRAVVSRGLGVNYDQVRKWDERGVIPSPYWNGLINLAAENLIYISLQLLADCVDISKK